jgi:allantoinase
MFERTISTIERFVGKRPVGWLGPGPTQTYDTPDYLAAAGIKYIGDWVYDEKPTTISTNHGPLVPLPYTIELNDITVMVVQHQEPAYWATKCIDAFNRLYKESENRTKIMAIAIHPYISGQPFVIKYHESVYGHIPKAKGGPPALHWRANSGLVFENIKGIGFSVLCLCEKTALEIFGI